MTQLQIELKDGIIKEHLLFFLVLQVCEIKVAAFGYSADEVSIYPMNSEIEMLYYEKNAQWKIKKSELKPFTLGEVDGMVTGIVHLQRRPEYFALNILAPIFLLCFLNPFVFLLPPESGERISYTVTIFLSLAVFMTLFSDTMPRSSEPMARISYFLLVAMAYSTVLCIFAILLMRMYYRSERKTIPRWLLRLVSVLSCRCLRCKKKPKVKIIQVSDMYKAQEKTQEFNMQANDQEGYLRMIKDWKSLVAELDKIAFVYSMVFIMILVVVVLLNLS